METRLGFVFLLIGVFFLLCLVEAQNQEGFISLDCGLSRGETYVDKYSNIIYTSDEDYIDVGVPMSIQSDYRSSFDKETWYLRSFPYGLKNCYNLNLKKGDKYLLRAKFLYGNYDNKSETPGFDLYIGPNRWVTVDISSKFFSTKYELIHELTSDKLQICLLKTGSTTPFISALELRLLDSKAYSTKSGSLMKDERYYMSNSTLLISSYPDDMYDRDWFSKYFTQDWKLVNTSLGVDTDTPYGLPKSFMKYAAAPRNDSVKFVYSWYDFSSPTKYEVFLHFAEVGNLKANESREFNITFNGNYMFGPYSPPRLKADTVQSPTALDTEDSEFEIGFVKTEGSTLPPILNAIEVYKVVELPLLGTDETDVDAMIKIKALYGLNITSWQGDPCLPQNVLWSGLNCSYKESDPPRITSLKLSSSGLKGQIAPSIANLTELTELDLSNNNLTGKIPEFLASLKSLSIINLSGNQFSGSVPEALLKKQQDGSLKLNVDAISTPIKGKTNIVVPVVATVAALVVLLAAVATFCIIWKKKPKDLKAAGVPRGVQSTVSGRNEPSERPSPLTKDPRVTYSDVLSITNNFNRVLGRGGFGIVYHGYMNDAPVAVKMLSQTSVQGYKQFKAEVELLLRVHHRHLVSLVGYCNEDDKQALIYEYMANGDLKEYLSGERGGKILSWEDRLRIATEAAQGLEYLHNGCKPQIIHRDVKATNILLNERFQAKLSDFGLSKSFPAGGETHVSTVVAGTPGYLDPEYYQTNRLTEKNDVYSFGVVLLEIITNRAVIDRTREKAHINEWVGMMLSRGDINNIVDKQLHGDFDTNSVWKLVELAMACVNPSSAKRPAMNHVVMELNECVRAELRRTQASRETDFTNDSSSIELTMNLTTEMRPAAR